MSELCKCVCVFNGVCHGCFVCISLPRAYGVALLAMLVSCLLHLVATAYFLFVEILGANVRKVEGGTFAIKKTMQHGCTLHTKVSERRPGAHISNWNWNYLYTLS